MAFMIVKNNAQLTAEEEAKAQQALPIEQQRESSQLAQFVRKCWEKAVKAKEPIAKLMIEGMRQREGEYPPEKLAAIKAIGVGSEVFMMITSAKCRSGEAWLRDILFPPGQKPWGIEPTPMPELPEGLADALRQAFMQEVAMQMQIRMATMGIPPNPDMIAMFLFDNRDKIDAQINKIFEDEAHKKAGEMELRIEDQLIEGGFYKALGDALFDVITLKACCIKGPVKRIENLRVIKNGKGALGVKVETRTIPQYDRVSPFDLFPGPNATGVNDGFLIERIPLRRDQIASMLKLPESAGFVHSEIRAVLQEFTSGGLREWTSIDSEKEVLENRDSDIHDSDKIDCLQFWGPVPGKVLKLWGGKLAKSVEDPDLDYNIVTNLIGGHIIQVSMNDDPMGEKPYSVTAYDKKPGAFWGNGVPELISDCQQVANASARAIVNNVGIASGPQVERNIDRIPEGENKQIYPWKVWDVTNEMAMATGPALQFYMPPMVVEKLILVYDKFTKIADEHSGIPAYSHGDPQVGGAGNTSSGLSMLMSAAARGIKSVVRNLDEDIISTCVKRQYYANVAEKEFRALVGDLKIVAKGSSALLAKEQQTVRLNEFARTTANPIDLQITGTEGRKYILKKVAQGLDLDVGKAVPESFGPMAPQGMLPGAPQLPGAAPMPNPQNVDAAGNPAQGKAFQLIEGGPTNA